MTTHVQTFDHGRIRELRLARPPVNALDPSLCRALIAALDAAMTGDVDAVVLAGAPGIELAVSQAIYRSDATVRRASALQAHPLTVGPRAVLNPETAASVGLADGMMGKFSTAAGTAALPVALSEKVSAGVVWVESGYGATAPLAASRVEVKSA